MGLQEDLRRFVEMDHNYPLFRTGVAGNILVVIGGIWLVLGWLISFYLFVDGYCFFTGLSEAGCKAFLKSGKFVIYGILSTAGGWLAGSFFLGGIYKRWFDFDTVLRKTEKKFKVDKRSGYPMLLTDKAIELYGLNRVLGDPISRIEKRRMRGSRGVVW